MLDVFVGRQPIYTRELEVFAYELLFRSGTGNRAVFADADQATSQVILNTFMEIGLEHIVGEKMAFINLTRSFVLQDYVLALPSNRIALEILEDIEVDADIIASVRRLSAQGYLIALDDFVYHEQLRPLLELADIIKLDILALGRKAVQEHVEILKAPEYNFKMLAEKVETQDDFEFCMALGFDYFQGYFLCRPNVIRGQRLPTNRLALLQLLSRLQDPAIQLPELELLVGQDLSMSYKLLRCLNSAIYQLPQKIESIDQALLILGTQGLQTWASLILLASIDDKPDELLQTALVRARMCELLAIALGQAEHKQHYFTSGLFSVLDALLDQPMQIILATLPLPGDIVQALLNHQGRLGNILRCVLDYERGDWDDLDTLGLEMDRITHVYLEALGWAGQANKELRKESSLDILH